MIQLQGKPAQRITRQRIEAGGNENEIGNEAYGRSIDPRFESRDIPIRRERRGHGDVPDTLVRTPILGCSGTWIPRPLVHGDEMDVGLGLHQRLGAVAVVHVPVDYQNPLQSMLSARVVRGQRYVAEETESHGAVRNRVVSGRSYGGEAPWVCARNREIDSEKSAASAGRRGVPGPLAYNRVGVEASPALLGHLPDVPDVFVGVSELELLQHRVTTFDVLDAGKEVGVVPERAGDRAQAAHVLRMSPARVVPAAIAV